MQHVDEVELAAGHVKDIETSISGQNQVDIEVDIQAGGGPSVASVGRLLASGPPFDHFGAQCRARLVTYRHTRSLIFLSKARANSGQH